MMFHEKPSLIPMWDASARHPLGVGLLASLRSHLLVGKRKRERERATEREGESDSSGTTKSINFISAGHESCSWCDCFSSVSSSRPHVILFNGTETFLDRWPLLSGTLKPPCAPHPHTSLSGNLLSYTVVLFILLYGPASLQYLSPVIYIRLVMEVKVNTANPTGYVHKY